METYITLTVLEKGAAKAPIQVENATATKHEIPRNSPQPITEPIVSEQIQTPPNGD